jgi:predicted dehydrogenase
LKLDDVEVVAFCDVEPRALQSTAAAFGVSRVYQDGHQMLDIEEFDVLYSLVPARARTDVEATAAEKGVHIFSEKPQALTMRVARRIDDAIQRSGVISTVGFRERYHPIFQEARRLLAGKDIVHVRFQSIRASPDPEWPDMEEWGGPGVNWGVHAVDYVRFITCLEIVRAQAFYCVRPAYPVALSQSFHYAFSNGATMTMTFVMITDQVLADEPWFVVFYEGGCLSVHGYDRIEVNGEMVYRAAAFDPWFEQDRTFIEAVRTGDTSALLNDYHDGLRSLAPVLAGWESHRREGECIDVEAFMNPLARTAAR